MNTRGSGVLRPHLIRFAARFLVAALVAGMTVHGLARAGAPADQAAPAALPVQTAAPAMVSTTSMGSDTYESRVQRLVNKRRVARGLPRLRVATCPDVTATDWSLHLATTQTFYHQDMGAVLDRCSARYASETLGRGSMGPRRLVRMWMQSSTHRAVLLSSKPRRIGIGATTDLDGRWVVAANFIRF